MKNRDLSIAVCGAVFGIILGSLSSNVGGSTQASIASDLFSYVPFHYAPDAEDYSRRKVDERGIPVYNDAGAIPGYPTLKESAGTSSAVAAPKDMTPCGMVKRAVAKVQKVYDTVIPQNIGNTAVRQRMNAAFADALAECPTVTEAVTTSSSSSVTATVDNDCEKYPRRTIRYSQCVLSEQNGRTYP